MTARVLQIRSALSESLTTFAASANAQLSALGAITPLAFTVSQARLDVVVITVTYLEGGSAAAGIAAGYDPADPTPAAAEGLLNTFFSANPAYTVRFIRSVAPQAGQPRNPMVLVLFSLAPPALATDVYMRVPAPAINVGGGIVSGAVGSLNVVDNAGTIIDTLQVRNRSGFVWPAGGEGWVMWEDQSEEWIGYCSNCFAP